MKIAFFDVLFAHSVRNLYFGEVLATGLPLFRNDSLMKRKPDFSLPAIGRYVEALGAPYGLFRTLGDVSPEYDACGAPVFIAGNYAAVFRIRTADGKRRAL